MGSPLTIAVVLAFVVTAFATPLVARLAVRRGWLDLPDERKRHARVVPRLGGVALAAGILAGGAVLELWPGFGHGRTVLAMLVVSGALLWGIGLWDDLAGVGFKKKFAVQTVAAYALLLAGWRLDLAQLPVLGGLDAYGQALVAVPLCLLWVVGVVNSVNLLDGQDGLAGGVVFLAFCTLGTLAAAYGLPRLSAFCFVVAAALIAFLAFNWAPATIFMGDSGSLLLGFLLSAVAYRVADAAPTALAMLAPVVALGLPILDTASTMVRRLVERRSPFAPDADHVHHRMSRAADSVPLGVVVLCAVAALYGGCALLVGLGSPPVALAGLGAAVALSYLLLRQLSYVRIRVVLRRAQRQWRHARRYARTEPGGLRAGVRRAFLPEGRFPAPPRVAPPAEAPPVRLSAGDGHDGALTLRVPPELLAEDARPVS